MNTIIRFKDPTFYQGRNGLGTQIGIEVSNVHGSLQMQPVNNTGVSYAARLEVPAEHVVEFMEALKVLFEDKETADQLAKILQWERIGHRGHLVSQIFSAANGRAYVEFPGNGRCDVDMKDLHEFGK